MSATDGASNVVTNNYQVGVTGPSSSYLIFDANGNMTSDGVKTFAWDAEDRLIKITYPGSGNYSQILYDASGIKGQITETVANTLTSTKQFVNSRTRFCEERDASGAVAKKFFGWGQTISGSNYFYNFDHLGSIRDMTDSSGVVQTHYEYELYGQTIKTAGALDSDFQYAGYYMHKGSGLCLAAHRAYAPKTGSWISRDTIGEAGGVNLYTYCQGNPVSFSDPSGTNPGAIAGGFAGSPAGPIGIAVGATVGAVVFTAGAYGAWQAGQWVRKKYSEHCNESCPPPPPDELGNLSDCFEWCRDHCKTNHGYQNCWTVCWERVAGGP